MSHFCKRIEFFHQMQAAATNIETNESLIVEHLLISRFKDSKVILSSYKKSSFLMLGYPSHINSFSSEFDFFQSGMLNFEKF